MVLPDDMEKRSFPEQLELLTVAYGGALHYSQGLTLLATGTAQDYGENILALRAQRFIQQLAAEEEMEAEAVFERVLEITRELEAEFHWTCHKLGWPSDWVREAMLRAAHRLAESAGALEGGQGVLPSPDLEYEATMDEIHGPPPEGVDPLLDLPEGIKLASRDDQLAALGEAYGGLIRDMLAEDELSSGKLDGAEARRVQAKLAAEAERVGEADDTPALHRWLTLRQAEDAQLHWAARALGMPTSSVISYLKRRRRQSP